ncbi:MAG TPA: ATP-binding cassette domain-containing protein [Phycisphaerae bacterium]|nr:ATP-binding cassette domain-containing protein [Phycisphaerae bacterium]HRY67522.1 ATP-binding cassette domain-containing protein [Phycisphaerae bacterium]HSA24909.1 ATP-binding cassette domain-containing protein [Phycisphaerae bacterium]
MPQIEVHQLSRIFKVPERESSFKAALASLFNRRYREVRAVDDISFSIEQGEIVGFLGPNGAGKTTTLKMLAGLLHPTSGTASVLGYTPWRREADYLSRISMVMGQRSQLLWDLPAMDSFRVQLAVYRVDKNSGRDTLDEMIAMLDIGDVLRKQVRTLSLGERMKCEICLSLLHRPAVLFLDEPTLGLDVTMQGRIREFVAEYNHRHGATIILTSHYMADVTALCKRIVVIDHGKILFDGPLADLSARLAPFKVISIDLETSPDGYNFDRIGEVCARKDQKVSIRVPRERAAALAGRLLAELPVRDVTVEDPPIEDVIKMVFARGMEQTP